MTQPDLPPRQHDAYQRLRKRIQAWLATKKGRNSRWAEYLLFAPDLFHLMARLALDSRVPATERAKLAAAVAYFVSPFNIIPETLLGPVVLSGDLALAAYVVNSVIEQAGPEVVRRHWAGDEDVLDVVQKVLGAADRWLGGRTWQKIRRTTRS
jgi:uncharacterized membrane protein YkvA (DUF1232 family)